MSDLFPSAMDELTPEQQAAWWQSAKQIPSVAASRFATGLASLATPPHAKDSGPITGYLPGLVSGILPMAADLASAPGKINDYLFGKIGMEPRVHPTEPAVIDASRKLFESSLDRAADYVPQVDYDPNDPALRLVDAGATTAGMAAIGGPSRLLTGAPRILRAAIPAASHIPRNAAFMGTLGGAGDALAQVVEADEKEQVATPQATQPSLPTPPIPPRGGATPLKPAPIMVDLPKSEVAPAQLPPFTTDLAAGSTLGDQFATWMGAPQPISPGREIIPHERNPLVVPQADTYDPAQAKIAPPIYEGPGTGSTQSGVGYGQAIGAAITLAGLGHVGRRLRVQPRDMTLVGQIERANERNFVGESQRYNDERAKINAGDLVRSTAELKAGEAPIPGRASTAGRESLNFAAAVYDKDAHAKEYARAIAENRREGEKLAAQIGNTSDLSAWERKITTQMQTGYDPVSGVRHEPIAKLFRDYGRMDEPTQQLVDRVMKAADSMDDRNMNAAAARRGTATQQVNTLFDVAGTDLQAEMAAGRANPIVRDWTERAWKIGLSNMDAAGARGFYTKSEVARIKSQRPHHLAGVDIDGDINRAFGPRPLNQTGAQTVPHRAIDAMKQHYYEFYRAMERNEMNRALLDEGYAFQRRYPHAAKMFEKWGARGNIGHNAAVPAAGPSHEPVITVRDHSGTSTHRIGESHIYNTMRGSQLQHNVAGQAANYTRQLVQQYSTGPLSVLSGGFFPAKNFLRGAIQLPINAPREMRSGGVIERATGLRMLDPTRLVGMGHTALADVFNQNAAKIGRILEPNAQNPVSSTLRRYLGNNTVDALSQRLANIYNRSVTAEMDRHGVSDVGGYGAREKSQYGIGSSGGKFDTNPANRLAPEAFYPKWPVYLGGKWVPRAAVAFRSIFEDLHNAVNDAANRYFYRVNRGTTEQNKLTYESRRLFGNPGQHGGNKYVRGTLNATPYGNITVQSIGRFAGAVADNPMATGTTIASVLVPLALFEMYSSMRSPAHVEAMQQNFSTAQLADGPKIMTDDNDPSIFSSISLPQELRAFYAMTREMVATLIGFHQVLTDPDAHADFLELAQDFWSHKVKTMTWDAIKTGADDAFGFTAPPLMNLGTRLLGGGDIKVKPVQIVSDIAGGNFGIRTFMQPLGVDHKLPNQEAGNSILDSENNRKNESLLSLAFGATSGMWSSLTDSWNVGKELGVGAGLSYLAQDLGQTAVDRNPQFNFIWGQQMAQSARPPIVARVEETMNLLKPLMTASSDVRNEGMTGGGFARLPIVPKGEGAVPTDPQMRTMYMTAGAYGTWVQGKIMPQINAVRAQLQSAQNSSLSPDIKRSIANKGNNEIAELYRAADAHLGDLNIELSRQAGGRPVDINGHIDWKGDIHQFDPH